MQKKYIARVDLADEKAGKRLTAIECGAKDDVALPPGTSLICEEDWVALSKAAGGEVALLAQLGIVETAAVEVKPK
jgi:hypothetical protein